MSLSGAMSNALGGLTVAARSAGLVSSNIANATTPGYGHRSLEVSSSTLSPNGGVQVAGVQRRSDPSLVADRRLADAEAGRQATMATFAQSLETAFGDLQTGEGLVSALSNLDSALVNAATDPASPTRLDALARSANSVVSEFNDLSNALQAAREGADAAIARDVERLNIGLSRVEGLNAEILSAAANGRDTSALEDQRQTVVDGISEIVPLRVIAKEQGAVALYTQNGGILLDGQAAEISFSHTPIILPHMTAENGLLSGLQVNGEPVRLDERGYLSGGTLGANLEIRDQAAVTVQAGLDGLALDLGQRFGAGGPDGSLLPGDAGVFTDEGGVIEGADETGLAGRLALNADLMAGSDTIWKWRDGLGAVTQGPAGEARLIQSLRGALTQRALPASLALPQANLSPADHATTLMSSAAAARLDAQVAQGFANNRQTALVEMELAQGVDTDAELQTLLRLEQSYAANARVITAVDEMLQRLLAI